MNKNFKRNFILLAFCALAGIFVLSGIVTAADDMAEESLQPIDIQPAMDTPSRDMNSTVDKDLFKESKGFGRDFEDELTIKTGDGARHDFTIELALSPKEQEKGLMFRQSMPAMHGMLFVFGSEMQRSFWMKNTLIPLDIIFLERDGRIQHIHSMAKPQDLSMVTSGKPSYAVLELNGGTASKLGINTGDFVFHTAFRNKNLQ